MFNKPADMNITQWTIVGELDSLCDRIKNAVYFMPIEESCKDELLRSLVTSSVFTCLASKIRVIENPE